MDTQVVPGEVVDRYPHVFRPIEVGTFTTSTIAWWCRRTVAATAASSGSDADFEQHAALWLAKLAGGMRWLGGGPNFVRNPLPPGFEPTGVGAHGPGFFRDPRYPARIGELAARVHAGGGLLSVQMVLQGGMPIAPVDHAVELRRPPHPARPRPRRGAVADPRVRRVGRHRHRRRRRRDRDPRQPRRRRAVVPVPADQPPRRRVRRLGRAAATVPARGRRGDPRPRLAPRHRSGCGSASTR